jgi:TRAP-type C4-dicarboxylate transport system substrate-binding protein
MMFRTLDEVDYTTSGPRSRNDFKKGFRGALLGRCRLGPSSRAARLRPADLKSQKMFVWQGDNTQVDLMKGYGYQPVPLETSDIYTSLQTGMIDAVPSIPYYALAGQFFSQAKHMLELNWAPLVGGAVVSKKTWDVIPEAARQTMAAARRSRAADSGSVAAGK